MMSKLNFYQFEIDALKKMVPLQPINFESDFDETEVDVLADSRYALHLQNSLVVHPSKFSPKSVRLTKYLGNNSPKDVLEEFFENITYHLLVKVNILVILVKLINFL